MSSILAKLQGYKTVAFNTVVGVVTCAFIVSGHADQASANAAVVAQNLNTILEAATSIAVVGNTILRFLTTSPVFSGPVAVVTSPAVVPSVTKKV